MTEAEKLARTVRFLILGAVGLVLVVVVGLAGSVAVRWGWDATTTSRGERVAACAVTLTERQPTRSGAFALSQNPGSPAPWSRESVACGKTGGNVDEAIKLAEKAP